MKPKSAKPVIFCIGILFALFSHSYADERILSFDSFIKVNNDGSLQVSETIKVRSAQEKIRRGIYRDFPTHYRDRSGNNYVVGFKLLRILRDGMPEHHSEKTLDKGVRVYIGRDNVYLPSGEYTYTIEYLTHRQLGFFKDFDELYWNVTGNDWDFPIEKVSCIVALPMGANTEVRERDAYTGPVGARGKNFTVGIDERGYTRFTATAPLGRHEGMTIVVNWPKGLVAEPTLRQKMNYIIKDNAGVMAGVIGLIFILAYYLYVWYWAGRDPQKGVIIPLYEPDKNISPAAMRYILRMGYDDKVFAAAIINMAVKGYLIIRQEGDEYTLEKSGKIEVNLNPEELAAAKILFERGSIITLRNRNHLVIRDAISKLQGRLKNAFEATYFITNKKHFIKGAVISLAALGIAGLLQAGPRTPVAVFMTVWLSIWSFGVFAMGLSIFNSWKVAGNKAGAIGLTLFAVPFFIGEIFGLCALAWATSILFLLFFGAVIFINILFYYLLKAPTILGRKVMDRIEGFKMYLSVAERYELKTAALSKETADLYEKYLPYALALDVEQQWSERFSEILARTTKEGQSYRPVWFSSASMTGFSVASFASCLSGSFSGAISSSRAAPGSGSGGGGGGSSGGGGGGGGGGGW